jgi:hypothetical protein
MKITPDSVTAVALRKFGLLSSAITIALFGLIIPWLTKTGLPQWPWYLAAGLILWSLMWPSGLIAIYRPWLKFGQIAGWINTRIILFLLFYLLFLPMGIMMKLVAYDPMRTRINRSLKSYRVISTIKNDNHMEKPY